MKAVRRHVEQVDVVEAQAVGESLGERGGVGGSHRDDRVDEQAEEGELGLGRRGARGEELGVSPERLAQDCEQRPLAAYVVEEGVHLVHRGQLHLEPIGGEGDHLFVLRRPIGRWRG